MKVISQTYFIVHYVLRRLLIEPSRKLAWLNKKKPFDHIGSKGLHFKLYPNEYIDKYIYIEGIYEKRFLDFIVNRVNSGGVMLDVGANIGNHSIFLAGKFDQVHSFEPNPTALERLRLNIELNSIHNIHVHPIGLSNETASMPFVGEVSGNLGCCHFEERSSAATTTLSVEKGDDCIENIKLRGITFIKIDVEGHELQVLQGLAETIKRELPLIAFEFHAHNKSSQAFSSLKKTLPQYQFFELVYAQPQDSPLTKFWFNFKRLGQPDIAPVCEPESRTYENMLAIPESKNEEFFGNINPAS